MDFCNLNRGLKDLYGEKYTQFFKFDQEFESDDELMDLLNKNNQSSIDERREKLQSYLKALSRMEIF